MILRNLQEITWQFDLPKSAQAVLSSVAVARYGFFFRLACTNLFCFILPCYFFTVPKVLEVVAQREYKNPVTGGRSIALDIYAQDSEGKIYDIEVQRSNEGADVHRARFHSSMLDTKMLKEKQAFKEIHDSYVIFITENDIMGAGLPLYHIERAVTETGNAFGDGSYIVYVNGSYKKDNDPVGKLVHDFRCTNAADMFYEELAKPVRHFKETEGGRREMCEAMEKFGERRELETRIKIALRMLADGKLANEKIAEYSNLSIEKIEELAVTKQP